LTFDTTSNDKYIFVKKMTFLIMNYELIIQQNNNRNFMKIVKSLYRLVTLLAVILFYAFPLKAQVTIGSQDAPRKFSILELVSNESGLRLPQLSTIERDNLKLDELTDPDIVQAAEGLLIYNIDTGCLEFWNGSKWISLCLSVTPTLTVYPLDLSFDATGEPSQSVTVTTNASGGWVITSKPDWITTTLDDITGDLFYVKAISNESGALRTGHITITAGTLTKNISIVQFDLTSDLGDGSEIAPYLICTPEQLDAIRKEPNACYLLCQNIDLTDYLAPDGEGYKKWGINGWLPIGDASTSFSGSIDGAGYTISGLRIQRSVTNNLGLFGVVNNGQIKNLAVNLTNNITGGTGTYVGGLAGLVTGSRSVISNCSVTGTGTVSGSSYIGGIAGGIHGGAGITGSFASVAISGSNSTGGLVGLVGQNGNGSGSLTNCYAKGNVTGGGSNIGGLVGQLYNGSLTNCYAAGAVYGTGTGNNDVVGGIVGRIGTVGSRVTYCVALNSSVSAAYGTDVGRVVGIVRDPANISNCWAFSGMTITDGSGNPVNTGGGEHYNSQGATIPAGSETLSEWWTTAPLSGPGWDDIIWNFEDGQQPILSWQ